MLTSLRSPYSEIVPPRSVINTANFVSPKHLASYLHYLDSHDEAYLSYFWWREYYDITFKGWTAGVCELCRKLHDEEEPQRVVEDVEEWWYSGRCIDRLGGQDFYEDFSAYR